MKPKYEYIMSGCAHTRITLKGAAEPGTKERIRAVVDRTVDMLKNHQITGLYNAFTEFRPGERMHKAEYFPIPLHSDSGGLQIITRGFTADKKTKEGVYRNQAAASGFAMCFDEIPTTVGRNDSERFFDPSLVEEKAKQTAENIIEQAKMFEKLKADTKIFVIGQGNCYDTYLKWIDVIVKNVPKELYERICGMSMAATSCGYGALLDIERSFAFLNCDAPDEWKKRLHLLGVGSVARMAPLVGMIHGDQLKDMTISYDSTTHSSIISYRRFVEENNKFFDVPFGDKVSVMRYWKYCKDYYDIEADFDHFYEGFTRNRDNFKEKFGDDKLPIFHEMMIAMAMTSIFHTARFLEKITDSRKEYRNYVVKEGLGPLQYLPEVKTKEDYEAFVRNFSPYLPEARIALVGSASSLEGFFG